MASDVFISYSRKNSEFARKLIDRLTLKGKDAWVDWEGIPLTSPNWWNEIKQGIEQADSFLFIVSPASMASVVCNMELDYAYALNKRVIPLIYQEVESRDTFASIADYTPDEAMNERLGGKDPFAIAHENWNKLSHINWLFFRDDDAFDPAFERLITTVETDLPYVKAHTRYLSRAADWEREDRRADLLLFGEEIDRAETWLQQGEAYAAETPSSSAKVDVVNPLPQDLHREYIATSRVESDKRIQQLQELEDSRKRSDLAAEQARTEAQQAETEKQRAETARRRALRTLIAVAVASVVVIIAAVVITSGQVDDANQQVDEASTLAADADVTAVAANEQADDGAGTNLDAAILDFSLPEDGTYLLLATSSRGVTESATIDDTTSETSPQSFNLTYNGLEALPAAQIGSLGLEPVPAQGEITVAVSAEQPLILLPMQLDAEQTLSLTTQSEEFTDSLFYLFDPLGNRVAVNSGEGEDPAARIKGYTAPEAGLYLVIATVGGYTNPESPLFSAISYTLLVE